MDIKELELISCPAQDYWYYANKAEALLDVLDSTRITSVLDIGAGSGFFSEYILKNTHASVAYCVDPNYETESVRNINSKEMHFLKNIETTEVDLILMMDVLEHVQDDVGLIQEYLKKTPQHSTFLITVPAFRFLWSGHDVYLGHYRRYTINSLRSTLNKAGLSVDLCFYYFGLVFPLAAMLRLASKFKKNNAPARSDLRQLGVYTNAILKRLGHVEKKIMRLNKIAGLTIFCMARKK